MSYSNKIGGYFGAGWFRDLWRIPEYVKDANNDPSYLTTIIITESKYHDSYQDKLAFTTIIEKVYFTSI